jgi:hypothetical protein
MKKIALMVVLGLLLQIVPAKVLASGPPPPGTSIVAIGALAVLGVVIFEDNQSKPSAKATGNEFQDLNNNPAFSSLLKQMAGGSLNTLEILK